MKIKVAPLAFMSERGSSLLRLIQNNEMPALDLLIRESIQNSLDASLKDKEFVNIQFNVTEFDSLIMNKNFEGITDELNSRFPRGTYKLLEIKDSNTVGLTGPLLEKDVKNNNYGNFQKLVYQISMRQEKEGSGGSWGLGKTVYFRLGIGLVLYYSRIRNEEGNFESRLAACLVEDESKKGGLLKVINEQPHRGIAWWGELMADGDTKAITNDKAIESILTSMNVSLYKGEETGTTIVIPYLDEEKLLNETNVAESKGNKKAQVWWTNNIQDYLRISIQRWYAPRLMNTEYKYGSWLRVSVNGKGIIKEDMQSMFRIIQDLYNFATQNSKNPSGIEEQAIFHQKVISLRKNTFKKSARAGVVAYTKLNREHLKMLAPNNQPSPYVQISNFYNEQDFNDPIICFTRKPGMIVRYELNGVWTENIPKTGTDEFIVAIFVLDSENTLQNVGLNKEVKLEEYVRNGEKADHTSWNDWNFEGLRTTIVSRIQEQTRKVIAETYDKRAERSQGTKCMGLARTLAELLLPPEGFGNRPGVSPNKPSKTETTLTKSKNPILELGAPKYLDNELEMNFILNTGKKSSTMQLILKVSAESKDILANEWESNELFDTNFPFELRDFLLFDIQNYKKEKMSSNEVIELSWQQKEILLQEVKLKRLYSEKFHTSYGIEIELPDNKGRVLEGSFSLKKEASNLKASIDVKVIEGEAT